MRDVKEPEIRRAEIMDAAMQLFIEQGYTNTTTQDIVDKVNISSRFKAFSRFTRITFQRYKQHQADCKASKFDRCNLQRGHR